MSLERFWGQETEAHHDGVPICDACNANRGRLYIGEGGNRLCRFCFKAERAS